MAVRVIAAEAAGAVADQLQQGRAELSVVEVAGQHTRGMTVIDQRTLIDRPEPNCDRLTAVDDDAAWTVVMEAIAHFSS